MHPFATDSSERTTVPFAIAVLAILLSWAFSNLLASIGFTVSWWLEGPPGAWGTYGILLALFERWAWHWRIWRTLHFVKTPDLRGEWTVALTTSFDQHAQIYEGRAVIRQSWRSIGIRLTRASSTSDSFVGSVLVSNPHEWIVHYEYLNTPKPSAPDAMHMHRGSVELRFDCDATRGEGEYYSGRDRHNHGTLVFTRVTRN